MAKIALGACVENVLACADPLDNPAHLSKSQNHGALPVPLVARQPGEVIPFVSLSIRQVTRPAPERGSRHDNIWLARPGADLAAHTTVAAAKVYRIAVQTTRPSKPGTPAR